MACAVRNLSHGLSSVCSASEGLTWACPEPDVGVRPMVPQHVPRAKPREPKSCMVKMMLGEDVLWLCQRLRLVAFLFLPDLSFSGPRGLA